MSRVINSHMGPMYIETTCISDLLGLVWFYGISITVGYLMPNPFYTYISNI